MVRSTKQLFPASPSKFKRVFDSSVGAGNVDVEALDYGADPADYFGGPEGFA
jgi:hypothetical protein